VTGAASGSGDARFSRNRPAWIGMSSSRGFWLAAALVVASWASIMFRVPTFDLDESLYRRLAEEMKLSGDYVIPTWDGEPFYEKPPTYFWTILLASRLFDPRDAPVSVFASRLPSFLFTLMMVACIGIFWPRLLSNLDGRRPITTSCPSSGGCASSSRSASTTRRSCGPGGRGREWSRASAA